MSPLPTFRKLVHVSDAHEGPVNCLQFSPEGKFLASGGDDGCVCVFTEAKWRRFNTKQNQVTTVAWFRDTQGGNKLFLLTGGVDGTVKLWKGTKELTFSLHAMKTVLMDHAIEGMALFDSTLAVVGRGGLYLYDIKSDAAVGERIHPVHVGLEKMSEEGGIMRAVCFFNGGTSVMVGCLDSKAIIAWEIRTKKRLWREKIHTRIGNMAWSEDLRLLCIWNLTDGMDLYKLEDAAAARPLYQRRIPVAIHRNLPFQVTFLSRYGLACGSDTGEAFIWDCGDEAKVLQQLTHTSTGSLVVQAIAHGQSTKNGRHLLATGSADIGKRGAIVVWTTEKGKWRFPWKFALFVMLALLGGLGSLIGLQYRKELERSRLAEERLNELKMFISRSNEITERIRAHAQALESSKLKLDELELKRELDGKEPQPEDLETLNVVDHGLLGDVETIVGPMSGQLESSAAAEGGVPHAPVDPTPSEAHAPVDPTPSKASEEDEAVPDQESVPNDVEGEGLDELLSRAWKRLSLYIPMFP
ncbi:hypothetical protein CC1G_04097 [Coprinopsis cinerea okayama7|uniref:Uncharacterized protein n=1 Tax=Coprinopsis cinerea (strain Okayama-7 / 130 / ATCC MYA-4618 / FGSC 9003) TaxID=240176 RepID=A8NVZ0_COPC7|nr:hypothetical protein CC1G_04097 [Coprinopsis cinerea okayama7\|eukprot:XP_001836784.1 hypothetical protein CC1G_04097 [Coprinopsis cinerea okayama7\